MTSTAATVDQTDASTTHIPNDGDACADCADITRAKGPAVRFSQCRGCHGAGVADRDTCRSCGGLGVVKHYTCSDASSGRPCNAQVFRDGAWIILRARVHRVGYGCANGHRWFRHHRVVRTAEADGTHFRDHWTWERTEDES